MRFEVGEYLALSLLCSLIALAMVEALIRLWLVNRPSAVLRFRMLVLALPPPVAGLSTLLHSYVQPALRTNGIVLFETANWSRLLGDDSNILWLLFSFLAAGGAATLLFQTILPIMRQYVRGRQQITLEACRFPRIYDVLQRLSTAHYLPPVVRVLEEGRPVAYVCGIWNQTIFVSTGLISMLDDEELEGVLAHEASHIRKGHMRLNWIIFFLRSLMFYNPVATLAFNQVSLEIERECDQDAVFTTGKRLAFASALLKVHRVTAANRGTRVGAIRNRRGTFRLAAWGNQARYALTRDRVERILGVASQRDTGYVGLRITLTAIAATAVMVLVT